MLTGCGTATFECGIQTILEVQNFFDCHIPVGKLDKCTVVDKCGTTLSIHISNWYFTPRQESPDEALVKLTMDIDPSGYLEVLA